MDRKDYFSHLISLYEAGKDLPEQNEIADAGSDLDEKNLDNAPELQDDIMGTPEQDVEIPADQEIPDDIDDASYMQEQPVEQQVNVGDTERRLRLFNLFKNMLNYSDSLFKTIDNVDLSTLNDDDISGINELKRILNSTKEKINDYMMRMFGDAKYEQALYIYVLLRSELLLNISKLREILLKDSEND